MEVIIGCARDELPIEYLGVPLCAKVLKGQGWNPLIETKARGMIRKILIYRRKDNVVQLCLICHPLYLLSIFRALV